jgi:dihydroorotase-like cyclic amidohydrolase
MRARRSFLTVLSVALTVGLALAPAAPAAVHPAFLLPPLRRRRYDGVVVTMDNGSRVTQAVAMGDGRIQAVGKSKEVLATQGPRTTLVDLQGRTVLPGFVDPHVHYLHHSVGDLGATLDDQEALLAWGRTTVGVPAARPRDLAWFQKLANNPLAQSGYDLLDNHVVATITEGELVWCGDFRWCGIP